MPNSFAKVMPLYFQAAVALGFSTVPLGPILWANAYDQIDPGMLDVFSDGPNAGQLAYRGCCMQGPPLDLAKVLDAPGFLLSTLICDGTTPFTINPKLPPRILFAPFTIANIPDLVGGVNVRFIGAILALLANVRQTNMIPPAELGRVMTLCAAGVLCVPASNNACNNAYGLSFPGLPCAPVFGPENEGPGSTAWGYIVNQFQPACEIYPQDQVNAAALAQGAGFGPAWVRIYNICNGITIVRPIPPGKSGLGKQTPAAPRAPAFFRYASSLDGQLALSALTTLIIIWIAKRK